MQFIGKVGNRSVFAGVFLPSYRGSVEPENLKFRKTKSSWQIGAVFWWVLRPQTPIHVAKVLQSGLSLKIAAMGKILIGLPTISVLEASAVTLRPNEPNSLQKLSII